MKRGNRKRLNDFLEAMRREYKVSVRQGKYDKARRIKAFVNTNAALLNQRNKASGKCQESPLR